MLLNLYNNLELFLEQPTVNFGLDSQFTFSILITILPELILFTGIFIIIIVLGMAYSSNTTNILVATIRLVSYSIIICSLLIIVITWLWFYLIPMNDCTITFLEGTYSINFYTQFLKIIITISTLYLYKYFNLPSNKINAAELPLLIHICTLLTFIIISCTNFAILLLSLEGFSLALYILTTIDRSRGGITAAAKYFVFGTLGSVLMLWGVVHLYSFYYNISYSSILTLSQLMLVNNDIILMQSSYNFATISILIGLLIKLGAAPVHQWVPDVYTGVHLVITAYFATVVKFIIFIIFCIIAYCNNYNSIIYFFAICSLLVGSLVTLRQTEIKRFLAYSSISHVGFLLIGDLTAVYIYMLVYICSSLLFFSVLLSLTINEKEIIYLSDLRFIKKGGLWSPFALTISLSSMAGLPPFAGFFGKYLVWVSLIEDILLFNNLESYILLIVSIFLNLITIYYYMRLIIYIYLPSDFEPIFAPNSQYLNIDHFQAILVIISIFWIFLQPKILSIISYININ